MCEGCVVAFRGMDAPSFRQRIAIALVAVFAIVLSGCGDEKKTVETTTTTTLESTRQIPPGTFPDGSSVRAIQEKGEITIGVPFAQPPFGEKNAQGVPEGFDIEIAKLVTQGIFGGTVDEVTTKIKFVDAVSANRELFLKDGTVDLIVSTYGVTDMRKTYVDFAGPYLVATGDVMVRSEENAIAGVSDLNGKPVCTKTGSTYAQALRTQAPDASLIERENLRQCQTALESGEVVAVANDHIILSGLVQASGKRFKVLNATLTTDPYGIGVKKGDDVMRNYVNERLIHTQQTGDWANAFATTIGRLEVATPTPPTIETTTTTTTTTAAPVPAESTSTTPPAG